VSPRINVVTLNVADLERALTFYRDALGLDSPTVTGTFQTSFLITATLATP
jgi:catechol 2,3-dioxygenase-like lactoylglutathione lyase family enzyme